MRQVQAARWTAPALLAAMGAAAFWDGLYAPGQQLVAATLAALLALAVRRRVFLGRVEWAGIALVATGALVSLRSPAAAGVAAHGPAVVAGWFLAMVAGRALAGRTDGRPAEPERNGPPERAEEETGDRVARHLGRFWAVTGALMAFVGMVAISCTPLHHSGRLASFMGYPIAVGVLGLLGLTGSLPDLAGGRPWAWAAALGNGLAILLSGSRWLWATGFLLTLYLLWASPGLIRQALRGAALSLGVALAAGLWAAPAVAAREPLPLVVTVLAALLTVEILRRFQRVRPVLAVVAVGWAAAVALAPGWPWLLGRATALPLTEGSSVERLTFLRDGIRLAAAHPWGAGYRGWSALHLQGASYSYYSAEVHSAPLDLAIAFGWPGGLGFLLLLVRFLAAFRHGRAWSPHRLGALAGMGGLALHALLDWDLSYGLFSFPLWFSFGLVLPGVAASAPDPSSETGAAPTHARVAGGFWPEGLTTGLAAFTLAAGALIGAGDLFTALAGASLQRGAPEAALRHAGAALAVVPWNDLSHAYWGEAAARLGLEEEAVAALRRARALGPREPWYAELLARRLAAQGRWREAAGAWRDVVALWPWHLPAYEEALQAHVDLIRRAMEAGDEALALDLASSGEAILDALARQKAKEPPRTPRAPMQTDTPAIQQAAALIRHVLQR